MEFALNLGKNNLLHNFLEVKKNRGRKKKVEEEKNIEKMKKKEFNTIYLEEVEKYKKKKEFEMYAY